jgi:hypothetical protein
MKVDALIKKLSKDGFTIARHGNGYRVRRNHMIGSFASHNGRPVQFHTACVRVETDYTEGYQPKTVHYSCSRFLAALTED